MFSCEEIERLVGAALPGATVTVREVAGDGEHFEAEVESEQFRGKRPVAQHQMVYRALGDAMHTKIHALALTTRTPDTGEEA